MISSMRFTPEQVEKGRLLFAGNANSIAASNLLINLPPLGLPEVAFAGRSNVATRWSMC